MKKIAATAGSLFALLVALSIFPSVAQTPQFPQTLPPNTVVGRTGISAGPAQAIPFATLSANLSFAPGVDQNVLNTQVVNYTILTSDCGRTIQAGTGSTGFFTLTLPAVAGFASNCAVTVKNSDTGRGKGLSGFPSDLNSILWPLQTATVKIVNGAWQTTVNPGRWKLPSGPTFNIDNVNGNDANDGLATGSGNAIASLTKFNSIVTNQLDTQGTIVTALLAAGQSWTALSLNAVITGGGTLNLNGNGDTVTSTAAGVGAITVNVSPTYGAGFLNVGAVVQNVNITCSGGGNGLLITQGFVALGAVSAPNFGSCPGGSHIQVDSPLSRLLLQQNYTINGGASYHLVAIGGGLIDWNSASFTVTLTGTPAFSNCFAFSEIGAILVSFNVWSGAATGPRYCANTQGSIFTSNSGPNFFPGNAAGFVQTGGRYDSPGTPSVSGCGTSPGAPAGTDQSGSVVEGTTATGCTLTFTTANTPKACFFSSSVAALAAGIAVTVLNATTLTITHPSTSSATLYWNCPANS